MTVLETYQNQGKSSWEEFAHQAFAADLAVPSKMKYLPNFDSDTVIPQLLTVPSDFGFAARNPKDLWISRTVADQLFICIWVGSPEYAPL